MKVCVFWVWAFGFAMLKLIENSSSIEALYAYEQDKWVGDFLKVHNHHPYFFEGVKVSEKVLFVSNYEPILPLIDVVIIAIPSQFILSFLPKIKKFLKPWVILLNLSKGINNTTLKTTYQDTLSELRGNNFEYAILSWGMIAREVIEWRPLGAQIGVNSQEIGEKLTKIFAWTSLEVSISIGNIQNIELYASLKNVIAMMIGYYEWLGYSASTLGYYFCKIYKEVDAIIHLLGWSDGYDFSDFAVGGDLIATCFGDSRNRYLGKLIGSWKSPKEALDILIAEKKRAEGYETLKWIIRILPQNGTTPLISEFAQKVIIP